MTDRAMRTENKSEGLLIIPKVMFTVIVLRRKRPSNTPIPDTPVSGITLTSKLQTGYSHRQANPGIEGD